MNSCRRLIHPILTLMEWEVNIFTCIAVLPGEHCQKKQWKFLPKVLGNCPGISFNRERLAASIPAIYLIFSSGTLLLIFEKCLEGIKEDGKTNNPQTLRIWNCAIRVTGTVEDALFTSE